MSLQRWTRKRSARLNYLNLEIDSLVTVSSLQNLVQRFEKLRIVPLLLEYFSEPQVIETRQITKFSFQHPSHPTLEFCSRTSGC
ncbi:hypothetical protein XH93_05175 [Bradyrhizobium sp. CCBAU 51753]|nr:hypothetical protein XH93_05175 [Bradyrhizobium sp. CCBAU 51753]